MNALNLNQLPNSHPRRWALFVGVNYYQDESIPSLRFCINDAQALYELLVTNTNSGYAPERASLLMSQTGSLNHATRLSILKQLQAFANRAQSEDTLLFYFAGHGQSTEQEVYLCPADTELGTMIPDTSISLTRIREILDSSKAQAKVVILDACYTGVALRGLAHRSIRAPNNEFMTRLFPQGEGLAILHSTARSDAAFEWGEMEHGVFTYYLLEGLQGTANDKPDSVITVTEIYRYVAREVSTWAQQHGILMRPTLEFHGRGDLVITTVDFAGKKPLTPPLWPTVEHASTDALLASLRGGEQGFVGRARELQRTLNLIQTTPNMASLIQGGPGIGKTSFFNQIKHRLLTANSGKANIGQRSFCCFSIEPDTLSSCDDFVAELRAGIYHCLNISDSQLNNEPFRSNVELAAQLEELQQQASNVAFVVFLDVFDKVFHQCTDLEQQRIRGVVRSLIENERLHIMFVLSTLQELPAEYWSRLPVDVFTLPPLTEVENDQLVISLLSPHVTPKRNELALIFCYTGGIPYLTRLLIVKLIDLGSWTNPHLGISEERLKEAITAAVHSDRADSLLGSIYGSYLNDDQRFVLLRLAITEQHKLSIDEVARLSGRHKTALKELAKRDYLLELVDGAYQARIGLLIDWLLNWNGFEREIERLDVPIEQSYSGIVIISTTRQVFINGREIKKPLPDLQYRALEYLAQRRDEVVSKDNLAIALWPDESHAVDDQRIATVISRLRRDLDDRQGIYLETLPKQGYRLRNVIIRTSLARR